MRKSLIVMVISMPFLFSGISFADNNDESLFIALLDRLQIHKPANQSPEPRPAAAQKICCYYCGNNGKCQHKWIYDHQCDVVVGDVVDDSECGK